MLDIPSVGTDLLNRAMTHIAETEEEPTPLEMTLALCETLKKVVKGPVRDALIATAENHDDLIRRERDVVLSALQVDEVRIW